VEKSIQARVVDACADHWLASQPKGAQVLRGVRIPEAGASDLILLYPKQGSLLVLARSWPHAAAFPHVVGQAVGELAHLMDLPPQRAGELVMGTEIAADLLHAKAVQTRLCADSAAADLGLVFAVGYTDAEGHEPIRKRLQPVVELLVRWAGAGVPGMTRGVHLWSVKLGDKVAIEPVELAGASSAASSGTLASRKSTKRK
jgi:hypothetical protein